MSDSPRDVIAQVMFANHARHGVDQSAELELCREQSDAVLSAISEAGMVIVPHKATKIMEDAAFALTDDSDRWPTHPEKIWTAMINATK